MEDVALQAALERLAEADILLVQGLPPESDYRFKHALIQDAAYENLLKSRRQVLHRRVAEVLLNVGVPTAAPEPELLAYHFTQAGLNEAAIEWWGKAGRRSLERSALVEAVSQFTRALDQIASLPATPARRSEQIKLQSALITPLIHVKGYAAPETKAAAEQTRLLIEQAEAQGETPEDPLLWFSSLYGISVVNLVAFNGDVMRELAEQFSILAGKQEATVPIMIGHRLMGHALLMTGEIAKAQAHYSQGLALYDPVEHRPFATRFGTDISVAILGFRSLALWLLGYPDAALGDADCALKSAREIGHAATWMYALNHAAIFAHIHCGNYKAAKAELEELVALANEKGAPFWKALATINKGLLLALHGDESDAIKTFTSGMAAYQSTGATLYRPQHLSYLASAYAKVGQFEEAWRCISEAMMAVETNVIFAPGRSSVVPRVLLEGNPFKSRMCLLTRNIPIVNWQHSATFARSSECRFCVMGFQLACSSCTVLRYGRSRRSRSSWSRPSPTKR
jgi:tetratricopeptide (TPR) repeat protein